VLANTREISWLVDALSRVQVTIIGRFRCALIRITTIGAIASEAIVTFALITSVIICAFRIAAA